MSLLMPRLKVASSASMSSHVFLAEDIFSYVSTKVLPKIAKLLVLSTKNTDDDQDYCLMLLRLV